MALHAGPLWELRGARTWPQRGWPERGAEASGCGRDWGGGVSSLFCCPLWGRKGHLTKFAPETPHCELMYIMSFNLFDEPRR